MAVAMAFVGRSAVPGASSMGAEGPVGGGGASSHGRIGWMDAAKGAGIVLMTFGHVGEVPGAAGTWLLPALEVPTAWVYLFHMSAFFLLGGLTYRRGQRMRTFVAKKVRTLLVPYLVWSLYFPLKALVGAMMGAGGAGAALRAVGRSLVEVVVFGQGLWFLAAYLVGELVAHLVIDALRLDGWTLCAVGLSLVLASFWWFDRNASRGGGLPPFECVNGVKAAGLMCVGAYLRPHLPVARPWRRGPHAVVLAASLVAFFGVGGLALAACPPSCPWLPAAFAALFGSLALVFASLVMPRCDWLERVGRVSLVYYVIAPEATNVVRLFVLWLFRAVGAPAGAVAQWALGVAMTAAVLMLSRPIVTLVCRHLPWSVGMRP